MWRRPRLVTADTKSPATATWQTCQGGVEPSRRTRQRDGGGTWADNATAERREAGLPVAREGPCLASVASRVTCATTSRLDASRRSANPLARGSAATKVKRGRKRTRTQQRAGSEETGLFDMVNRKRRERRSGKRRARSHRVNGNALVSRPSARLGAPFCARCQFARESRDPGATRRAASGSRVSRSLPSGRAKRGPGGSPGTRERSPPEGAPSCGPLRRSGAVATSAAMLRLPGG
jgi:hypothetical protein